MANETLPEKTAKHIINLFHPWTRETSSNGLTNLRRASKQNDPPQLMLDLVDLCEQAYAPTVTLRRSNDTFRFLPIPNSTKIESNEQEDLEAEELMGPKGSYVGSKVWLTLFGALVKETPQGRRHFMVKAKVICKASGSQEAKHASPKKPLLEV